MKKIVHIIIGLTVGGAELMLQRLVTDSNLNNKDHFKHIVISLTGLDAIGPELKLKGVEVYNLGMHSLTSLPITYFKLRKLLKKIRPDTVQTWMYHSDLIGGIAAKSLRIDNIIWGIRNTEINSNRSFSRQTIIKACSILSYSIPDHILCVANTAKETHIKQGGYDPDKMIVIPNGFDINKFRPNEIQRNETRRKLNIADNELVIGNIGRYNPVKNHINLIKACISLLEQGYVFKVLLAGRNVDLSNPEIALLFKNNSLDRHFIFLGEISETPSFYNAIDIFCLCSTTEGFPNVLGEAMATAKLCMTTDVGDAKYLLGNNGFIIKDPSPFEIARCLRLNVLDNLDVLNSHIGEDARDRIKEYFDINMIINKFEELY